MVRENIKPDNFDSTFDAITRSKYGSHYSIVYHDLKVLRNMYPQLIKQHLEVNNDTVLFFMILQIGLENYYQNVRLT